MGDETTRRFVSRGGEKLSAALDHFGVDPTGQVCADLGSHVGGFVDCLLRYGAARVHSVDTAYGTLAWTLRKDQRVVVYERTNAMHVELPEPIELVTVDVGWTVQAKIMPNVATLLGNGGRAISLIKPHYEAQKSMLVDGVLPDEAQASVTSRVLDSLKQRGWRVEGLFDSPIRGHGGNAEVLALLTRC